MEGEEFFNFLREGGRNGKSEERGEMGSSMEREEELGFCRRKGFQREDSFVLEEFEVKAGDERCRIGEMGNLFVVGFIESKEGGSGFSRELRLEDDVCKGAGSLKGG